MTVVDEPSRQVVRRLQGLGPGTVVADVADLKRQIEHLKVAVETNRVIGAAVGILMERLQLDRRAAFDHLTRSSQHANVKLCLIAEGLVEETETGLSLVGGDQPATREQPEGRSTDQARAAGRVAVVPSAVGSAD